MRIVHGVHGYGRGHAVRSLAVLSALVRRHEVLVLAGRDAIPILAGFPIVPIPGLGSCYRGSHISTLLTLRGSAHVLSGLALPDVVVSDSEPLVLRAAEQRLKPAAPRRSP
jgi:hypothetical protein